MNSLLSKPSASSNPTASSTPTVSPASPFLALLRKDAEELALTWRLPLILILAVVLALSGPIITQNMRELVQMLGGDELTPVINTMPAATHLTAHSQWIKDLSQVFLLALAVTSGSAAASELNDGSYLFTLTRHVPRWKFLTSKFLCNLIIPFIAIIGATAINLVVTATVFGDVDVGRVAGAVLAWFVLAAIVVATAFTVGIATFSQVGSAGAAIGVVMLLQLLGTWSTTQSWSPAGILHQTEAILGGQSVNNLPLITGLLLVVGLFCTAIAILSRKEL
nr:ABC transporter permease subunit [Corynebacterium lactis]